MSWHRALAAGGWDQLTLGEQLGNIGSEVGRAIKAKTTADKTLAGQRALELLDLTLADKRWHGRGSELARAREVVADFLFGANIYQEDSIRLESYFMHFALAARLNR